ncbi:MAG: tyrosine-type recombinase/integrase [Pseudomonadota bacterium]|nr:tyrosine-type recombinase/integrase [Pseudomonadota bacterium]
MKRKLTDRTIKALKPKDKAYKSADGGGLYIYVSKVGAKSWRFDYEMSGKRQTLTIGEYPSIGLSDARQAHEQAREDIIKGKDPRARNKPKYMEKSFSYYALDTNKRLDLKPSTEKKRLERLNKYLFPILDKKRVDQITAIDVLNICQPLADAGKHETARLLATYCRQTFDTLLSMQLISSNPAESISRLLPKPKRENNFAHVTSPEDFKILLNGPEQYGGDFAVIKALQFMPLVFLRPHNIRFLRWAYVDLKERLITIPADEMKMNRPHKVPLSDQAIEILKQMKKVTGRNELVFTTARAKAGKQMSENTLNVAIQRFKHPQTGEALGKGFMTSHGFRHTASTMLNEMGFNADVIEMQLAHLDKDRIRRTYNKAELMAERTSMMQGWADYLDSLKRGAAVIPIKRKA